MPALDHSSTSASFNTTPPPPDGQWRGSSIVVEMPALDHSVVLRIIECCDWRTIRVLSCVPVFRQLIQRYCRSIIKAIIRPYIGRAITDSHFVLDSLGRYRGQPCYQRAVLPAVSWQAVAVIERRVALVNDVLNSEFLYTNDDSTWPSLSSPAERGTLRQMVREGICCCDRLADMEACVLGTESLDGFDAPPLAPVSLENEVAHRMGLVRRHVHVAPRTQAELGRDRYVRWRVRGRQGQYLRSLSTQQLLCIALLLHLAAMRLHSPRHQRLRPNAGMRRTYISGLNEVLLRHGTWFLSTWKAGPASCRGRYYHAFDLSILSAWDLRAYIFAGGIKWHGISQEEVSVALDRELRRRLDADRREDAVETQALLRVDEMIRGPQTVRPVTFMFATYAP